MMNKENINKTSEVLNMGLSDKKEKQIKRMPRIETRVEKLPGKNLLVHRTIITDIKPIAYYNAVIENAD